MKLASGTGLENIKPHFNIILSCFTVYDFHRGLNALKKYNVF